MIISYRMENYPKKRGIEKGEPERILIPTIEEMRATKNPFTDHARLIFNTLQLTILELLSTRAQYGGELTISPQQIKDFLLSLQTPDKSFVTGLQSIDDFYTADRSRVPLSPEEHERSMEAIREHRAMPYCDKPSDSVAAQNWKPTAPVIRTSRSGIHLTNVFFDESANSMTIESPEVTTTRVNLAVEPTVGERRVLQDLYKRFCANDILRERGFRMKSLGSRRTDSIIVYCGDKATSAVVGEMARYCADENIGNVPGIAFGLAPLRKDGKTLLNGLRVTDHPASDIGTFNDIQANALHAAFTAFSDETLGSWKPGATLTTADKEQLRRLLGEVRSERAASVALMIQNDYETAIRAQLGTEDSEDPIWNVAFPSHQQETQF